MFRRRAMRQLSLHSGGALLALTLFFLGEAAAKPATPGEGAKNARRVKIEWVRIPGGAFMMGSGTHDAQPKRRVTLAPFSLAKSEVTVGQYRACVEAGACAAPRTGGPCNWEREGRDAHPVNCVGWDEALAFSRWVGGTLPSEAEWEYAARGGGREVLYPWGNEAASCDYAVMDQRRGGRGCQKRRTWPVCSKARGHSAQGLCDLAGNVSEWVFDAYQESYAGAPRDGSPVRSTEEANEMRAKRVLRGGWWYGSPRHLRVTERGKMDPRFRSPKYGFRPRKGRHGSGE